MAWLALLLAGISEVGWAVGLKYTEGFTKLVPSLITIGGLVLSFWMLAFALKTLPLGTAYAIWTGIGTVEGKDIGLHFAGSRETRILRTHESLIFSGDEAVTCHLPEGPVRCLNLMVLRDKGTFDAGLKRGGGAVAADVDARFFMALALAGGLRIEMVGYPSIALAEGHAFIAEKWSSLTAERPVLHVDGDAVGFYASIMAA